MDQSNNEQARDQARSKLIQIFRYIQAFNHLQNPIQQEIQAQPWLLWFHDLPDHPCIRLHPGSLANTQPGSALSPSVPQEFPEQDFILKVSRPILTEPPDPPKDIRPWLQSGWQDVDGRVTIDSKKLAEFNTNTRRVRSLEEWKGQRHRWAELERPNRRTMEIFDQLYMLHARLKREAEKLELMVGDGVLDWHPKNHLRIHHPVLLLRLQLQFDPQIPEFTLAETEQPPELYTALFQSLPGVNALEIGRSRVAFEQGHGHPLSGYDTDQFLQRLVDQLAPEGDSSEPTRAQKEQRLPVITRDPVLFLRNRTLGFNTALEAILETLPQSDYLPQSLISLVDIEAKMGVKQEVHSSIPASISPNGEDEQILLSMPANIEQLEIVHRLEEYGAVLVQGPPGTGKTHTIANLLGHMLAQGKSVLVTSHTSKALKVLREKVVPSLQPLCVSVLEEDNREQMENAIDTITERLATSHIETLEQEVRDLTQQRMEILTQLRQTRTELRDIRSSEYQPIVIAGRHYTPAEAGRYVNNYQKDAAWIPDAVTTETLLPLSQAELVNLYHSNITVTPEDEHNVIEDLPDIKTLLSPHEFAYTIAEQDRLHSDDLNYKRDLWYNVTGSPSEETFQELHLQLIQALEPLQHCTRWQLAAVSAGRTGGPQRLVWDDLISKVEYTYKLSVEAQRMVMEYNPYIEENCLPDRIEKVLNEIIVYLQQHEKLHTFTLLTHRDWKTLIEHTQVKGRAPELREHFVALYTLVQLRSAREDLLGRWQRQMVPLGAPPSATLGPAPEQHCIQFVPSLRYHLEWYTKIWTPLEYRLKQCGLYWDKVLAETPINMAENGDWLRLYYTVHTVLPPVLAAESKRRSYTHHEAILQTLREQVQLISGITAQTEVFQQLQQAISTRSAQGYKAAYDHLLDLQERQQEVRNRNTLLENLEKVSPGWAAALRKREGIHGQSTVPHNVEEAWLWRQLNDELEKRAKISLEELQEKIAHQSSHLQDITTELIEKKAWAAQVRRTTVEQRQALQDWKEIMRKVGKGTGKRAPRLLAEARNLMPTCQTAVPVWIMPLSRVVQNFDPRHNHFDVVIIDEASQADITALAAIYMGQQVVIVGDHEQVTPLAVGQNLDDVQQLIDEHLQGINNALLYDGRLSVYALAQTTFDPICLREHFRCVAPIIQFSNALSYEGKIKPLRDDSEVMRRPATVAYQVKSTHPTTTTNEEEAQAIASLVVAASEQQEYQDATFGIISLIKDDQALRIDTLLQRYLPAKEYTRRQILSGNAAQFQGDERDVIFLSMVDTPRGNVPLPMRSEEAFDYMYKKRFNVAASRARDQLWVVYSLDPDLDLKDGDIRKRLIRHALNPYEFMKQSNEGEKRAESEFEQDVMGRLVQAGYRVIPQWAVGSYSIDLVVEGDGKRLAIECDGERWHTAESLEANMAQQAILERLGWRFMRIRGSQFFRDPDQAMKPVLTRLLDLGIPEQGSQTTLHKNVDSEQVLKEKIIQRAAALRLEWFQ